MAHIFKTIEEAEQFCNSFQSPPGREKPRTLTRMQRLMQLLGNPERQLHVITVTGSYGKSSTAYLIAAILEESGLRVGLHIKPHIQKITDRFSINRIPMSDNTFIRLVTDLQPVIEHMEDKPTLFELLVAIMILYFVQSRVDVAVVEVGRGGRVDATNILDALILVITNIFLIHTDILGSTKEKILEEKLGLLREHATIISGCEDPTLQQIMMDTAKTYHATVRLINRDFQLVGNDFTSPDLIVRNVAHPIQGSPQWENICLAIEAARTYTPVDSQTITAAVSAMHIPGRMEEVQYQTHTMIFDAAHNGEKMQFLEKELTARYPDTKFIVVIKNTDDQTQKRYRDILGPITKEFVVVHTDDVTPSETGISMNQFIDHYLTQRNSNWFLVTGGMQLAGILRTRLAIPFTLK